MSDNTNPTWVPQEDGTHLPSEQLLSAVRSNPEKYPNAVQDFASLSGKSEDDVKAILNNPSADQGVLRSIVSAPSRIGTDIVQGLVSGVGVATEKVGQLAGYTGLEGVESTLKAASDSVQGFADNIDPKFDTEKGVVEKLSETAGQAIPSIGAAIAAGGLAPAAAAGAGVAYFTFKDEDNLVQMIDEVTDGVMPGFLVINKDDDEGTRSLKAVAANLVSEFALAGASHMVARVWKAFKGKPTAKALEAIAAEGGIVIKAAGPEGVETAIKGARGALEDISKSIKQPNAETIAKVAKVAADEQNAASVGARASGRAPVAQPMAPELVYRFRNETFGALDAELKRSRAINGGKAGQSEIDAFITGSEGRAAYIKQTDEVAASIMGEQYDQALAQIKDAKIGGSAARHAQWQNSILRSSLQLMEDRLDDIILKIRQDPSMKTRSAWRSLSSDVYEAKLRMAEMYRETGSSLSYGMLNRKLGIKSSDVGLLSAIDNTAAELTEAAKRQGYNILSTQSDFVLANAKKLEDMGFNTLNIIDELSVMFDEFDAIRQGQLASMRTNSVAKLSKAEREKLEGSFIKVLHDMHSSALLGQPSTAGLEVSSNFINNLLLPVANVTGGKLKNIPAGALRAKREYSGYMAGWNHSWNTFKKAYAMGKSVTDNFDVLDGAHASKIDYTKMKDDKAFATYTFMRLWKFAADLSVAASESQKAWRGFGMAYADGNELAIKSGMTKPQAKLKAKEYAQSMFDENGAFTDLSLKLDVSRTSWQSVIDTRYATGKPAQAIENLRNSKNPLVSTMSRATIPFFRTLVNIGGDAAQTVMPPSWMIRGISKATNKAGIHPELSARFIDDFTGKNGVRAQTRAQARQRMGMGMLFSTYSLIQSGAIEVTGPGGYQSWNAKMAQWETAPGSSIIIGDTSVDLTRFLPFSAPMLMAGIIRDKVRQSELEMSDGEYAGDVSEEETFPILMSSYGLFMTSLMSDAGSMRGVGELFGAIEKAVSEGDMSALTKFGTSYMKQFMPGLPRTVGKNLGVVDGDWDIYRGEGFLGEVMASAGFKAGAQYKRLDFLGNPVIDKWRGIDFTNSKVVKVKHDALYSEYARLNKDTELALSLPTPDRVFDKSFWENLGGRERGVLERIFDVDPRSLNQLKTNDGRNAYDVYRDMVYKGKAAKDITKSTSSSGDRVSVGLVVIKKGETMEDTLRRYVGWDGYQDLTPTAREKIWKSVFSVFKKNSKDYLAEIVKVTPEVFEDSRYGTPIDKPSSIAATQKAGKALAGKVQTTRGYPEGLDAIFAIK